MYNTLLFIESPVQIIFVLIIALVVFGPKRLPELGKQLGTGLRELNKAKNDLMRSINTDHEPDPEPYRETYAYPPSTDLAHSNSYNYHDYNYQAAPDLTDYTIAGQEPKISPVENSVARSSEPLASESADYSLNLSTLGSGAASTTDHPSNTSHESHEAPVEALKQGEAHV